MRQKGDAAVAGGLSVAQAANMGSNMEIYLTYGSMAAVMLLITLFFYNYKNWIPLRRNSVYMRILVVAVLTITLDMFLTVLRGKNPSYASVLAEWSGVAAYTGIVIIGYCLFQYDLAIVKRIRWQRRWWCRLLVVYVAFAITVSLTAPLTGISLLRLQRGERYFPDFKGIQFISVVACILAGLLVLIFMRHHLKKREWIVLLAGHGLLLGDSILQSFLPARYIISYCNLAFVLVMYYMVMHNTDQYRYRASGCFVRAGFQKAVRELVHYRIPYVCLGMTINNIESITNYCTEEEIEWVHAQLGKILQRVCGRRYVYHIHSFEYVVILRNMELAKRRHQELLKAVPAYLRYHDKNISITCGFYTLGLADAEFNTANFNRILTSMRKMAMEDMDRSHLLQYTGECQRNIRRDLAALRLVNDSVASKTFTISPVFIWGRGEERPHSCELIMTREAERGMILNQERIWGYTAELGYIKDFGYLSCELMCQYIRGNVSPKEDSKQNTLFRDMDRIHMNFTSSQIASTVVAKAYIDILQKYGIQGEKLCFEITIDLNTNYERLAESMVVFKEYGIMLLLDQFGVTVCNLKDVLNMSFDAVKINEHMVRTFCRGENSQLKFLVRMLAFRGWKIYLDGVDDDKQLEMLCPLKISYMQGGLFAVSALWKAAEAASLEKPEVETGSRNGGVAIG